MEWRVFLIGPMAEPHGDQIPKLHDFIVARITERHGYEMEAGEAAIGTVLRNREGDTITVSTPERSSSLADIPTNVFHQLDNADLVMADLSGNRPAVVYELASAHALGVETILVGGRDTQTFYFSQIRFHEADFQAEPLVSRTLGQDLDFWMNTRLKLRVAQNPFHRFYGAPLLDTSASNGLATGFYDNFVPPILVDGKIVERRSSRRWLGLGRRRGDETIRDLEGLIVLRPDSLMAEIRTVEGRLEDVLTRGFGGEVLKGRPNHLFIRVAPQSPASGKGETRIPFLLVRGYVIDIPRTIFSLKLSRRLGRLKEVRSLELRLDRNMQHVLIECFFDNLKRFIRADRTIQSRGIAFHVGRAGELVEIIRTGKSQTFAFP